MTPQTLLNELDRHGYRLELAGDNLRVTPPQQGHEPELIANLRSYKQEVIALITSRQALAPSAAAADGYFPLSDMQQAYLLGRADDVAGGGVSSHVFHEIDATGVDRERLEDALLQLFLRHPALRTEITPEGRQRVIAWPLPAWPGIRHHDLRQLDDAGQQASLAAIRTSMSHQVLPIEQGVWLQAQLASLPDGRQILFISHDGLAIDGISMLLLFRDWHRLYTGAPLPALSGEIDFRQYVAGKEGRRDGAAWERSKRWWLARLDAGFPSFPQIPLAQDAAGAGSRQWQRHVSLSSAAQYASLQEGARGNGLSMTAVVLSAWCEVLALWGAGDCFALNVTIADRPPDHPDGLQLIGNFTSNTLLSVEQGAPAGFVDRTKRLQQALLRDLEYREFSGLDLMRELQRRERDQRMPFTFNSTLGQGVEGLTGTSQFGPVLSSISQTPQVWLNVFVMEQDGELEVQLDVLDNLFPEGMIASMAAALQAGLQALASDAQAWQRQQLITLPADQLARRHSANDTRRAVPGKTLYEAFLASAQKNPQQVAVWTSGRQLSYGELLARSAEVAQWLEQARLGRGQLVAVLMPKGWEQIVAILGILRAGAAYLPLDPATPAARIATLLDNAEVAHVLTTRAVAGAGLAATGQGRQVLCVDQLDGLAQAPEWQPSHGQEALAYVIYTSGSTGTPKGVMVTHSNVVNLVSDINARYTVGAADVVFGISSFTFDLSVYDIFGALDAGATLVLPDQDKLTDAAHWLETATRTGVTIWNSVPAIVRMLVEEAGAHGALPPTLRHFLMSGDRIPVSLPTAIRARHASVALHSLGGPTETTVWNICYPIDPPDPRWVRIPYGKPTSNNRYYILDRQLERCPDWVTGELFAAGAGNAKGYWNDVQRTAASFFYHEGLQEHLYRTGDVGHYLPSGDIDISGRADFQVKLNGFRIEVGEIETLICRLPGIRECAVVLAQSAGSQTLVAYIAGQAGATDAALLRKALDSQIPAWMVPHHFIVVEHLPLTGNGKVDRQALTSRPLAAPVAAGAPAAPSTADDGLQQRVAALWAQLFRSAAPDYAQDFYLAGGDSLMAARLASAMRKEFGIRVSLGDLLRLRTIHEQAGYLQVRLQS